MQETQHGDRTTKDHFTVQLDEHDLEELVYDNERVIETDDFVATVIPPDSVDEGTLKSIACRLIRRL